MPEDGPKRELFDKLKSEAEQNRQKLKEKATKMEKNFFVREEHVLAHSSNVDIVHSDNFKGANLLKGMQFFRMVTKRQMPDNFLDILFQRDKMRPFASTNGSMPYQFNKDLDSEFLFIHAFEDLIEKALGEQEAIMVSKKSLVAFEETVSIEKVDQN